MGKWAEIGVMCWLPKASELEIGQITHCHNVDCDTYEKRIANLESQCIAERQQAAEHYKARLDAESRLARIAALVKPVPVADLVEAGTEAPALLAERHAAIRAILEEEK